MIERLRGELERRRSARPSAERAVAPRDRPPAGTSRGGWGAARGGVARGATARKSPAAGLSPIGAGMCPAAITAALDIAPRALAGWEEAAPSRGSSLLLWVTAAAAAGGLVLGELWASTAGLLGLLLYLYRAALVSARARGAVTELSLRVGALERRVSSVREGGPVAPEELLEEVRDLRGLVRGLFETLGQAPGNPSD